MKNAEVKFLRLQQVREITQLSRSSIYRLMSSGEFPKQIPITSRQVVWVKAHIEDWCNKKVEAALR
ncbi:MAG: AlpA family transcriptional regulator [Gammaproteobacteria bacterium]|nr:AlpA family transcriptional regulator [Gammaproteobacteria bacterium]|tara:strand:- start:5402 stop:5599 length:198 start_codon:yes stop_codon:yes gene_type:complete